MKLPNFVTLGVLVYAVSCSAVFASDVMNQKDISEENAFIENAAKKNTEVFGEVDSGLLLEDSFLGKITNKKTGDSIVFKCVKGESKEKCLEIGFFKVAIFGASEDAPFFKLDTREFVSTLKQKLERVTDASKADKYFPFVELFYGNDDGVVVGGQILAVLILSSFSLPAALGAATLPFVLDIVVGLPETLINRYSYNRAYHKAMKAIASGLQTGATVRVPNRAFNLILELQSLNN